jgi:hypothetical protein
MLSCYLKTTFKELLPVLLKEAIASNDLSSDKTLFQLKKRPGGTTFAAGQSTITTSAGTSPFAVRKGRRLCR